MWYVTLLGVPAALYYTIQCFKEIRTLEVNRIWMEYLHTRNFVKKYALWLAIASRDEKEASRFRWFSLSVLIVSCACFLMACMGYYYSLMVWKSGWDILGAVLNAALFLPFSVVIGIALTGLIKISSPVVTLENMPQEQEIEGKVSNQEPPEI